MTTDVDLHCESPDALVGVRQDADQRVVWTARHVIEEGVDLVASPARAAHGGSFVGHQPTSRPGQPGARGGGGLVPALTRRTLRQRDEFLLEQSGSLFEWLLLLCQEKLTRPQGHPRVLRPRQVRQPLQRLVQHSQVLHETWAFADVLEYGLDELDPGLQALVRTGIRQKLRNTILDALALQHFGRHVSGGLVEELLHLREGVHDVVEGRRRRRQQPVLKLAHEVEQRLKGRLVERQPGVVRGTLLLQETV
mmetsp:Transcript_25204/g.62452  ORF Transcript_25204/g.62452 Transcript_25204/m.62452 type:complete len:251 (-) Transcript_25204:2976-3728(-)